MRTNDLVVQVGLEIEVPFWESRSYKDVLDDLYNAGYLEGGRETWKKWHQYGCRCSYGRCNDVRNGVILYPPIVSATYDASLPEGGMEIVTSPIIIANSGLEALREIWDITVEDAVWTTEHDSMQGDPCSPSVHVHASATQAYPSSAYSPNSLFQLQDCTRIVSYYGPELIALASLRPGQTRGLMYRLPVPYPDPIHHGLTHPRAFAPGNRVYVEWRGLEAYYDDWDYIESHALLYALLTFAMLDFDTVRELEAGSRIGWTAEQLHTLQEVVVEDKTDQLLSLFSVERFNHLKTIVLSAADAAAEPIGAAKVQALFDQLGDQYGFDT